MWMVSSPDATILRLKTPFSQIHRLYGHYEILFS